jgi:hypothetical protein
LREEKRQFYIPKCFFFPNIFEILRIFFTFFCKKAHVVVLRRMEGGGGDGAEDVRIRVPDQQEDRRHILLPFGHLAVQRGEGEAVLLRAVDLHPAMLEK